MGTPATPESLERLYERLHVECPPGVWSKAVTLARAGQVIEEAHDGSEFTLRVHVKDRPNSPKVSLWPDEDDCFCDCAEFQARNDLCLHVAAAVIAVRNKLTARREAPAADSTAEKTSSDSRGMAPFVRYLFTRTPEGLSLERVIARGARDEPLDGSLIGLVGGISSGRVPGPTLATTKEDFAADAALSSQKRGVLARETLAAVLTALRDSGTVMLDGARVQVGIAVVPRAIVVDDASGGFRIEPEGGGVPVEEFRNGGALIGNSLRPVPQRLPASVSERRVFPVRDAHVLVCELIPELRKKIALEVRTSRLPVLRADAKPRIVIRIEKGADASLAAIATLVYGEPAVAEVVEGRLQLASPRETPARDEAEEWRLTRKLQTELHLTLGRLTKFEGEAAVRFTAEAKGWDVTGGGAAAFSVRDALVPRIAIGEGGALSVSFFAGGGALGSGGGEGAGAQSADWKAVEQAWRQGHAYVPLLDGGYAPLPRDWLEKYGPRLSRLLAARDAHGKVPAFLLPELAAAADEAGAAYPESLAKIRRALENFEGIPGAKLPADLRATLRHYQERGIDWLHFLGELGLGALLADDMGLGKTLQALCAFPEPAQAKLSGGRTLVVCPTSVLSSWASQIAQFRPSLTVNLFHGAGRRLDERADVTLTTYSILRLDRELLTTRDWAAVVLDEAQTIKNPDSQVAQAAHELKAGVRMALSGTPIENRLDDLWSQFRFLNPGLLGSRRDFNESFARAPSEVRARLKPFILRRLKKEVAPELPPRTEIVLHCELSTSERELYDALMSATRAEVVAELQAGGNVIRALEALLRLRQACCHPSLVPGQKPGAAGPESSKVELLLETLQESIDYGHRALVFSQWTSFLDLIEPRLAAAGIAWERLDGTTTDRAGVVERFQRPDGPPVLLLSLKAGGVGLTLTAADHIFLMDPWWNPAVEDQAADRAHRIGQVNPVLIQRLIAKDTVEDRILALQKKKLEIAGAVLHDAEGALKLTREDLLELVN